MGRTHQFHWITEFGDVWYYCNPILPNPTILEALKQNYLFTTLSNSASFSLLTANWVKLPFSLFQKTYISLVNNVMKLYYSVTLLLSPQCEHMNPLFLRTNSTSNCRIIGCIHWAKIQVSKKERKNDYVTDWTKIISL